MIAPKGEYDFKQEDNELGLQNILAQNRYQSELQKQTDAEIYNKVYADIKTRNIQWPEPEVLNKKIS